MHVGIITYQTGHLKTWKMLLMLLSKPFKISVFAFPFIKREQDHDHRFADRPFQLIDIDIRQFCRNNGINYIEVPGWRDEDVKYLDNPNQDTTPDVYLVVIGKIIPRAFINNRIIINAHPGHLPYNRGLDAFKWAVINCWPIAVSLHVIDEAIDRGIILKTKRVPVLPDDTLKDVAERAYEVECYLQSNFDYYLSNIRLKNRVTDDHQLSRKRISFEDDQKLEEIFLKNRERLVELSQEEE
jgi:phosphoribosylglycinamide formyltransferase-1